MTSEKGSAGLLLLGGFTGSFAAFAFVHGGYSGDGDGPALLEEVFGEGLRIG
jgi:hypothetical protein